MNSAEEIYSVDVNAEGSLVAYGGNTDTVFIADFPSLKIQQEIDDFTDSIFYLKFLENNLIVVVTLDGVVALFSLSNKQYAEFCRVDLEEDVSKAEFINDHFYIGTTKGSIHIFNTSFSEESLLKGHDTTIQEIIVTKEKILSLSTDRFIIYDSQTHNILYKRTIYEGFCMSYSQDHDIIYFSTELDSYVVKDDIVLKKYSFAGDYSIFANNFFLVGGKGHSINLINLSNGCSFEQIQFNDQKLEGITKIINLDHNIVAFSTVCGKIGMGDFTCASTFKFFDGKVGVIYNFLFFYRHIIVVGMFGINIIQL